MNNNFYNTYAVVANIVVSKILGFSQSFDKFAEEYDSRPDVATSKNATETAIDIIKNNKDDAFLLWVHFMDPHGYYLDHDEFDYSSEYKGKLSKSLVGKELEKVKE